MPDVKNILVHCEEMEIIPSFLASNLAPYALCLTPRGFYIALEINMGL